MMLEHHLLSFRLSSVKWHGAPHNFWTLTYDITATRINNFVLEGILSKLEDYCFKPRMLEHVVLHPYISNNKLIVEIAGAIQYDPEQTEKINKELKVLLEDVANTFYDFLYTEGMFLATLEPFYVREEYLTENTAFQIIKAGESWAIVVDTGSDKWGELVERFKEEDMVKEISKVGDYIDLILFKENVSNKQILNVVQEFFDHWR